MAPSNRLTAAIARTNSANRAGPITVAPPGGRPVPYSVEEDELIMRLKNHAHMDWSDIVARFPERKSKVNIQVRFSRGLFAGSKAVADVEAFRAHFGIAPNLDQSGLYFTRANGVHFRTPGSDIAVPAYGPTITVAGAPHTVVPPPAVASGAGPIPTPPAVTSATAPEISPPISVASSSSTPSREPQPPTTAAKEPVSAAPIPTASSSHSDDAPGNTPLPVASGPGPKPDTGPQSPVLGRGASRSTGRKRRASPEWRIDVEDPALVETGGFRLKASDENWKENQNWAVNRNSRKHKFCPEGVPDVTHRDSPQYAALEADLRTREATFPREGKSVVREQPPPPSAPIARPVEQLSRFGEVPAVIAIDALATSRLAAWLEPRKESNFPPSMIRERPGWFVYSRDVRFSMSNFRQDEETTRMELEGGGKRTRRRT